MKKVYLSLAIALVAVACKSNKMASVGSASAPANAECSTKKECSGEAKAACEGAKSCEGAKVCPVTGKPMN